MNCIRLLKVLPLALALLAPACKSMNTTEPAHPVGQKQLVEDRRITSDPSLNRRVRIVGVNTAETPEGYLKVQVELHNPTRSLQNFSYRFEWFNLQGMEVSSSAQAFIPKQIEGRESLYVSAMAPTIACKDFRLKLIENVR
jgi:uncharacterized protein YcfL